MEGTDALLPSIRFEILHYHLRDVQPRLTIGPSWSRPRGIFIGRCHHRGCSKHPAIERAIGPLSDHLLLQVLLKVFNCTNLQAGHED